MPKSGILTKEELIFISEGETKEIQIESRKIRALGYSGYTLYLRPYCSHEMNILTFAWSSISC